MNKYVRVKSIPTRGIDDPDILDNNHHWNDEQRCGMERPQEEKIKSYSEKSSSSIQEQPKSSHIDKSKINQLTKHILDRFPKA